jgi:hypothetical protein
MTKIIYKDSWKSLGIPLGHEYRDNNGNVSLEYLYMIHKTNKVIAKKFEIALNSMCTNYPTNPVIISWKIEEIDD